LPEIVGRMLGVAVLFLWCASEVLWFIIFNRCDESQARLKITAVIWLVACSLGIAVELAFMVTGRL
jgi:hypothetical protein